ncbi:50S ribosomal protein L24 [Buchnera aphidicola (Pemphigus obesinymphae)]|uniref:50S ribosomal protein L24 n=1 Tax=Buchnera aphidicola TaxID=9 RepID=UPI0022373A4C|nr:50S ribosomal protein L24 [Buchnera aphidicola]MCW5196410.1 50S ribosomal protein L24 [Buchnera aphidicola (Pemphigus obesinymphae)]
MANKIRCNDKVVILAGKDKGKIGIVKRLLSSNRIIVEGINVVKKHQKSVPAQNKPGGIISKESGIHISNVAIFNSITEKADRIGFRFEEGKKVRFFKSNKKNLHNVGL